jgi:SAM-dependent methyltransferase
VLIQIVCSITSPGPGARGGGTISIGKLAPDSLPEPRKVVHIDPPPGAADLYRELVPPDSVVLDLMSAWRSHLPTEVKYRRVVGLGMNEEEMADNPELDRFVVHNLNSGEPLPFEDNTFDAALCAVSVQYLTRPVETFRETARVLKPGAPFIVTFSNRCFPTKAISLWLHTDEQSHMQIVALYFLASGQFDNVIYQDRSPGPQFDPLMPRGQEKCCVSGVALPFTVSLDILSTSATCCRQTPRGKCGCRQTLR